MYIRIAFAVSFLGFTFASVSPAFGQFQPLLITLDHNDDFVITGTGQEINGIEFRGPDGTFEFAPGSTGQVNEEGTEVSGSAPAPFHFLLSNISREVVMAAVPGTVARVDGSFPLQFGPQDLSLLDNVRVRVGVGSRPVENPLNLICDTCEYPSVERTPGGGIEVSNINDPIINLTVFASGGGLTITEVPVGVTVVDQTPTSVTLQNPDGFDTATLSNLNFLAGFSANQPVFAQFELANATSYGPFPVAIAAVPEPSGLVGAGISLVMCLAVRSSKRPSKRHCQAEVVAAMA